MVSEQRIKKTYEHKESGRVLYWMSREQRIRDNWGLLYAEELKDKFKTEMAVVFCLANSFLDATERQFNFMLQGLEEVATGLKKKNIPFYLLQGDPPQELKKFIGKYQIKHLVYDFDPLRIKQNWQMQLLNTGTAAFYEVDSHNIVPARLASNKLEYGAYTIRPKINEKLEEFLEEFPELSTQNRLDAFRHKRIDFKKASKYLNVDKKVHPVVWLRPGETAAKNTFKKFMKNKLKIYGQKKNDPNYDAVSDLSPYLHFGHISSQRIAMEILKIPEKSENVDSFLEELIIRKELSDNYCFYNQWYDRLDNIPEWAKETLKAHKKDEREFVYSAEEFERANTHEQLWNAAQNQMIKTGKMHGYMRMYWAKKIMEWSPSFEEALQIAIYLNDRYELDGRDPNGYAGCAWAIGGVHDRAWKERPVFGKIRYMNFEGAKRKFNVSNYIEKWNS